jgi:hypothetical protein
MKTWVWILVVVATVALFLWTVRREGFQSTNTLHGPPYGGCTTFKTDGTCDGPNDYDQIVGMMPATLVAALKIKQDAGNAPVTPPVGASAGDVTRFRTEMLAYQRKLVDGLISSAMGEFYATVYQPATTPLTSANVDSFMTTYLASIQSTSPSVYTFLNANKADVKTLLVAYFVTQPAGAANAALTAAQTASAGASAASGYDAIRAGLGQLAAPTPSCPTGYTLSADKKTCMGPTTGDTKTPTCPTGFTYDNGACTVPSMGGGTGPTTGNSTGGSSVTPGSNSGTNKGNIFGPAYTGMGDNAGGPGGSGGSRDYPTLFGPTPKPSTMIEGAGIMNPSQNETLVTSGALPGSAQTGSDPNSRYFGSSRVPGDRDLVPDPYQEFTPSTGSSKTEPVPYLSDFSAFAR